MKQWQLTSFGQGNLEMTEAPVPTPGRSELLVRVAAASLNYRDKLVIEGMLAQHSPSLPFVPLSDMAGEVVAVGSDVSRFRTGDRVLGNFWPQWIDAKAPSDMHSLGGPLPGFLSEYVTLDEEVAVSTPASLTDEEASTLPIAALSAWFALVETGKLQRHDTVLVQGTGGVALFGLQIGHALGARVIVTSRSADKLERIKALGAFGTIDTSVMSEWSTLAQEMTDGHGVDHVLELIGGANLAQSVVSLASDGRISQIGFMGGTDMVLPAIPFASRRAIIQGINVGHRRAFEDMNRAIDEHGIKPVIDTVYDFDDALAAFEHLERGPFGKIVIRVSEN